MTRLLVLVFTSALSLAVLPGWAQDSAAVSSDGWKKVTELAAPEAVQAAAADEKFAYAIDNATVAKYDRSTGARIAVSSGPARHLNSGFFLGGKLYCAHSNYPRKPEESEIKILDPASMELSTFKDFGNYGGSLTWAVFEQGHWWCNFAHYREDNAKTFLVKFDADWKELARYSYPAEVLRELKTYSISGGIWLDQRLLVSDHDHRVLYELQLPEAGSELRFVVKRPAPFTGQGIAFDSKTNGLVGIDRGKKQIIFAQFAQ